MKRWFGFAVASILLFCASFANAEEGDAKWTLTFLNFNQDNKFITGAAANPDVLMTMALEKGSQGTEGKLKRSIDGGANFSPVNVELFGGMFFMATDIQFLNEDLGFLAGLSMGMMGVSAGPMWRVTNKGASVEALTVEGWPECTKLYCLNTEQCWASCPDGQMIRTSDSGDSWQFSTLPVNDLKPGPIHFLNENLGWVAMYDSLEEETDMDGEIIQEYEVLERGTIFKTTDGGESWTKLAEGMRSVFNHMQFINEQIGFLAAADETLGYLMKTTNAGQTWVEVPLQPSYESQYGAMPLYDIGGIEFLNEQEGWIALNYGERGTGAMGIVKMIHTTDGGQTWDVHDVYDGEGAVTTGFIFDLDMVDEHVGFAFGEMQALYVFDDGFYDEQPFPDGDEDPTADGDIDPNVDGDVDTGPTYTGKPSDPCPLIQDESTWDAYPRCDESLGAEICLWKEGETESFCTMECTTSDDCKGQYPNYHPDACCKTITFEDEEKSICLFDPTLCIRTGYEGQWHGYTEPLLGESCGGDNPCDPYYGGDWCLGGDTGNFCSQACSSDADCRGGFQTNYCCDGYHEQTGDYCLYGAAACGGVDPDGDETGADGDIDTIAGGDTDTTNANGTGSGAESSGGGGCKHTGTPAALLLVILLGLAMKRRMI